MGVIFSFYNENIISPQHDLPGCLEHHSPKNKNAIFFLFTTILQPFIAFLLWARHCEYSLACRV
jgi:hypothetical protein